MDAPAPAQPDRLARLPRWMAGGTTLLAGLVLGGLLLHATGRVLTDRAWWSQYLWWIPAVVSIVLATGGLVVSHGAAWLARWLDARASSRVGRRVRGIAWIGVAAALAHALFVEWRPPGGEDLIPREERFRVAYWNFSYHGEAGWERPATNLDPDLFVTLAGSCTSGDGITRWLGDGRDYFFDTTFVVASKAPVVCWAFVDLKIRQGQGIDPRQADFVRHGRDPGRGAILLIDARERLGRDLVVWLIDLPSDLSLWRDAVTREAAAAMLERPAYAKVLNADRRSFRRVPMTDEWAERFQRPDLIVGDFNIPRGSASLRHLARGAENAFDQAGEGYSASFPRRFALWHLDQVFVTRPLRAVRYEVITPFSGSHRLQVADVVRGRSVSAPAGAGAGAAH